MPVSSVTDMYRLISPPAELILSSVGRTVPVFFFLSDFCVRSGGRMIVNCNKTTFTLSCTPFATHNNSCHYTSFLNEHNLHDYWFMSPSWWVNTFRCLEGLVTPIFRVVQYTFKLQENSINLAFLTIRHLRKVVAWPEVLLSLTHGVHTESMIWSCVIWTLLSPSSYYIGFKRSNCNFLRNLKRLGGLYVANDKERLWLPKSCIVNHLSYKETEGETDR